MHCFTPYKNVSRWRALRYAILLLLLLSVSSILLIVMGITGFNASGAIVINIPVVYHCLTLAWLLCFIFVIIYTNYRLSYSCRHYWDSILHSFIITTRHTPLFTTITPIRRHHCFSHHAITPLCYHAHCRLPLSLFPYRRLSLFTYQRRCYSYVIKKERDATGIVLRRLLAPGAITMNTTLSRWALSCHAYVTLIIGDTGY